MHGGSGIQEGSLLFPLPALRERIRVRGEPMNFEFATATRVIFGAGKLKEIGDLAREFGKHPLVVTGKNPTRAQPLLALLEEPRGILSATTFPVGGEPTLFDVQK